MKHANYFNTLLEVERQCPVIKVFTKNSLNEEVVSCELSLSREIAVFLDKYISKYDLR